MNVIQRMVEAGMTIDCARDTAMWYMAQGDDYGLEAYVLELEESKKKENHEI